MINYKLIGCGGLELCRNWQVGSMIKLTNKQQAFGITSSLSSVLSHNLIHELVHLLFKFDSFGRDNVPSLYVGQIAFVQREIVGVHEGDIPRDAWLFGEGFKNAVDLDSFILPFRVWQEQDFSVRRFPWGQVDQAAVFTLPHNMKLCFEPNPLELKNRPSELLFSAVGGNMLWNDRKTFSEWFVSEGFVCD